LTRNTQCGIPWCAAGQFSNSENDNKCTPCPNGTFSNVSGASSIQTCEMCEAGSYSFAGSSACVQCEVGKFSAVLGLNVSACVKCPAGTYAPEAGSTTCIACPGGTFNGEAGSEVCYMCEAGTASSSTS
jgi:hypothetical protein